MELFALILEFLYNLIYFLFIYLFDIFIICKDLNPYLFYFLLIYLLIYCCHWAIFA